MSKAMNGDLVKVHYTGKKEDDTIVGTSGEEPIAFVIGDGRVIPGIEKGVIGMTVGDTKTITVPPDDGFGPVREELKTVIDKSKFPDSVEPAIGKHLELRGKSGDTVKARIVDVQEDSVFVDANHPLAGQSLKLDIELVDIMR